MSGANCPSGVPINLLFFDGINADKRKASAPVVCPLIYYPLMELMLAHEWSKLPQSCLNRNAFEYWKRLLRRCWRLKRKTKNKKILKKCVATPLENCQYLCRRVAKVKKHFVIPKNLVFDMQQKDLQNPDNINNLKKCVATTLGNCQYLCRRVTKVKKHIVRRKTWISTCSRKEQ